MTRNPWSTATGAITPPPWQGESHVHRIPDEEEPPKPAPEVKQEPPDPSLFARGKVAGQGEAGDMEAAKGDERKCAT